MTDNQVNAIGNEIKRRIEAEEADGPTSVVALISMAKAGKLTPKHIQQVLNIVYTDKIKLLAVLVESQKLVSEEIVDTIIQEVRATK